MDVQANNGLDREFVSSALVHRNSLFRLARSLTRNTTSAEDLLQETFLKAYRAFESFKTETNCHAWLARIMLNTYINLYNRQQKVVFRQEVENELSRHPARRTRECQIGFNYDENDLLRNHVCDQIRQSLMLLSPEYRAVVILYDMLGLTYQEIADNLGSPIGTIKSRLFRGRKALKRNLSRHSCDPARGGVV